MGPGIAMDPFSYPGPLGVRDSKTGGLDDRLARITTRRGVTLWVNVSSSLPGQLRAALRAHAIQCLPHECVGLIVISGNRWWAMALPAKVSTKGFAIEPTVWARTLENLERHHVEIWATYHSHPSGRLQPSGRDHVLWWTSERLLLLAPEGERIAIAQYEWRP